MIDENSARFLWDDRELIRQRAIRRKRWLWHSLTGIDETASRGEIASPELGPNGSLCPYSSMGTLDWVAYARRHLGIVGHPDASILENESDGSSRLSRTLILAGVGTAAFLIRRYRS